MNANNNKQNEVFDYIVIGAGSSGCIVASRLVREANATVLLIERGPKAAENPDTLSADGFKYCFANDNVMLDRFSESQKGLNDRVVYQGTGSTMGGSGSVNGMVYTRGDKADFAAWPKGWQWDDIAPHFSAVEAELKPQSRVATGFTQAAIDACGEIGIAHKDGLNDGQLGGYIGHNDMNYQGEYRRSSYAAFIHTYLNSDELNKLTIVNHAITRKIIIENKTAVGVEYEIDGNVIQAKVKKEVILSAGALETPKLLMLSGVGPKAELKRFHIPLLLDSPYIGENLHDHPNVPIFFTGKKNIDFNYPQLYGFDRMNSDLPLADSAQPDTCFAFFSAPITLHQSMHRMVPVLALPRKLYGFKPLRIILRKMIDVAFKIPKLNKMIDKTYGIVVILGKPLSRGRVGLASANAKDQALVDPAYYSNPADMDTVIKGVEKVQEMIAQAPLKAWGARPLGPGGAIKGREKITKFIQGATMTTYHFCGSCKMGTDETSPVTTDLKLKGINNLRIADASVIPEVPVSAINAPSMMIGHRAADFIMQEALKNQSTQAEKATA